MLWGMAIHAMAVGGLGVLLFSVWGSLWSPSSRQELVGAQKQSVWHCCLCPAQHCHQVWVPFAKGFSSHQLGLVLGSLEFAFTQCFPLRSCRQLKWLLLCKEEKVYYKKSGFWWQLLLPHSVLYGQNRRDLCLEVHLLLLGKKWGAGQVGLWQGRRCGSGAPSSSAHLCISPGMQLTALIMGNVCALTEREKPRIYCLKNKSSEASRIHVVLC